MQRREFLKAAVLGTGSTLVLGPVRAWALTPPVLSGTVLSSTSIRLDWTDAGDEQKYLIFRDGNQISSRAANTLTFTTTGLTPNTTYLWRVDAKKGSTVIPSNTIQLTTTGGGGTNATATPMSVAAVAGVSMPAVNGGGGTFPSYGDGY